MKQASLFDAPPPAHHNGTEHEKAAARAFVVPGKNLKERIAWWIGKRQRYGAIRDEVDRCFNTTPNVSQPRLVELESEGRIRKTDRSRKGRSGRRGTVYVAFEFQD